MQMNETQVPQLDYLGGKNIGVTYHSFLLRLRTWNSQPEQNGCNFIYAGI